MKSWIKIFLIVSGLLVIGVVFVRPFQGDQQKVISEALAAPQNDIDDSRQNAITRAIAEASPAVVSINVTSVQEIYRENPWARDPFWRHFFSPYDRIQREVKGLGSGFIFTEKGHIITNQHVVENAEKIVITLPGGKQYDAERLGEDEKMDIAVLKIEGENFPSIKFGNSDNLIIGEWAIALGNPFGLFDISAKPTVTVGVISAVGQDFGEIDGKRVYEDMIQTDAAINSGNSGGPLVNSNGRVVGINSFIYSGDYRLGTNIGLAFAIPINRVKASLQEIIEHGRVQRDIWASIQYNDVTPYIAYYLDMSQSVGVIISQVDRNSPWDEAGLEAEDVILEINNQTIRNSQDVDKLKETLSLSKGEELNLRVYRNRRVYRAKVAVE